MAGFTGLQVAANGLRAHDNAMGVISDNLANMNTTAYKGSQTVFGDVMAQTIGSTGGGTKNQVGGGSRVSMVNPNFQQGSFSGTSQATDMAIDGRGFFVLENPTSGATSYTRAGNFNVDNSGFLVGPGGERVQGWRVMKEDGEVRIEGSATDHGDINLQDVQSVAEATSKISPRANLNASADPDAPKDTLRAGQAGDGQDFDYHFKTDATVYDSQGNSHIISVYFTKNANNQWSWRAMANASEVSQGASYDVNGDGQINDSDLRQVGSGQLTFDENGALATETADGGTYTNGGVQIQPQWSNGAAAGNIVLDMGNSRETDGGTGLDGVVQRSGNSVLFSAEVDGRPTGSLESFSVDDKGVLVGRFDNGTTQPLYKVAVADFVNPDGLERMGSNKFGVTQSSGNPVFKEPGTGGAGSIRGFSLEDSNINAAEEFTDMISVQRGYQANTKVISTVDEMLQSLMRVK